MENIVLERIWKRSGTLYVECIEGNLYTGEEQAHTFRITGQDENGTETPITGTITGKFLRADNLDVPLVGSLDDGVAELTLTEQCYDCRGRYVLSIFADDGEHKICIYCGTGNVFRTDGEGTIDPGNIIQDVSDLIDRIQTAIGQIPADYSALTARVTQTETDVSDLKSAFNSGSTFNALERLPYAISSSNGQWITGNLACVGVPCTGSKKLTTQTIKGRQTNIAFLKSYAPVVGETPDLCDGQSGRFNLPTAKTTYTIPSDCNYIYIMIMNSGNDYTPFMFEIDGMDYTKNIVHNLGHNIADTQVNTTNISANASKIDNVKSILDSQYQEVNVPYTVEEGAYYSQNGVKASLANFCVVTIDLSDVAAVKTYGYQTPNMAGLFFVDSNGNPIADTTGDMYHVASASGFNTIQIDKPSGAIAAKASFSISSGRTYTVSGFTYVFGGDSIEMPNLADVLMIPIFGQSLSVGAAATPVISATGKYDAGIMFSGGVNAAQKAVSYFTEFVPLSETPKNVETPASGCADKIVEQIQKEDGLSVLSEYWNDHKILFVSCGAGSKTITALMDDYYAGLQNAIQGAKNICDSEGLTLNVPCWIWIQGETDQKEGSGDSKPETTATDLETYKAKLIQLQGNLNTYAKGVTGQSNDLVCICYQSAAQNIVALVREPRYNNYNVMGVPTAQMQLIRDNASFVASSPVYVLDHSTVEPIHLSGVGSKMLGLYCGIAAKAVIFGETAPTGLVPASYAISGNTLTIKYNVPVPPIRIDTEWVKEVAHYGYMLLDSNNTDLITSVSVFDDTVTITCSASPLNAMLFYGFNGTAYRDGRVQGSRGNICDSAKFVFDGEIGGKRYTLGNYAYSFVKLLDAESGTI